MLEQIYGTAPVRNVALLPIPAVSPGEGHSSPAAWAHAEYRLMRQHLACQWSCRLETALTRICGEADAAAGQWQLLAINGWPLPADRDRDLAYLAYYPVLARAETASSDAGQPLPLSLVVLHVPGYAAQHAAAHDSPHFRAATGPALPPGTSPAPDQTRELLRSACTGGANLIHPSPRYHITR